jgi:hypothetical protein
VSQAAEILTELRRRGVIVAVDGDTLCLRPKHALDDGMLSRVREAKPAIFEALRNRLAEARTGSAACGSPHCAGCYHVGDGRKVHPPKCGEGYRKWLQSWQPKGKPQ